MKKIKKVVLLIFIMFFLCCYVYASLTSVSKVVSEFPNTYFISSFNELGSSVSSSLDEGNHKINMLSENEVILSFDYTDEYIEYNNRDSVVTEDNYSDEFKTIIFIEGIIESLFNLNGYENKISDWDKMEEVYNNDTSYDTYGIEMETEHFEFSGSYDDGATWSASGEHVKYFKISLDSDKIIELAKKFSTDISDDDDLSIFADLIPDLEARNITSNSVTLYAKVPGYDDDSDTIPYCIIYRSTSENGEYEELSDFYPACTGNVGLIDENLDSGATYYYKAKVMGGTEFSKVIKVNTLNVSQIENDIDADIINPKTGSTYIYLTIICLVISILAFYMMMRSIKRQNI